MSFVAGALLFLIASPALGVGLCGLIRPARPHQTRSEAGAVLLFGTITAAIAVWFFGQP